MAKTSASFDTAANGDDRGEEDADDHDQDDFLESDRQDWSPL